MGKEIKINTDLLKAVSKFHFRRFVESGKKECREAYFKTAYKYAVLTNDRTELK